MYVTLVAKVNLNVIVNSYPIFVGNLLPYACVCLCMCFPYFPFYSWRKIVNFNRQGRQQTTTHIHTATLPLHSGALFIRNITV